MEPATLLENGNKTQLCFSVSTLPETLLPALSNFKSFLKSFGVIFKPQNFLKYFSLFISFLKFLYPVFLILSVPLFALLYFFCYLYHWSITGVGLGCRFHLPRPANSIKNYEKIDEDFRLIEGTIFISFWDSGPFDRDAMEQNLVVKSSRVMRGNDLETNLGPGGNTKIRIFGTGFIASFKQMVSEPLTSARLIAEATCNGVTWRLKALHTGITWTRVIEALCSSVKLSPKASDTSVKEYFNTLCADSLLQVDLFLRLLQDLCTWTYKELLLFTLRKCVKGWRAAVRSITETISTKYQDLALVPRSTRNFIQCRRKIGRILAPVYGFLWSFTYSAIWAIIQCFQNKTAIIMFLPTCVGMPLLWGLQACRYVGRFLLFNSIGRCIASLFVVAIALLICNQINPLDWFQLPGPQPYADTGKFRPKDSIEFMRPPRKEVNRAE